MREFGRFEICCLVYATPFTICPHQNFYRKLRLRRWMEIFFHVFQQFGIFRPGFLIDQNLVHKLMDTCKVMRICFFCLFFISICPNLNLYLEPNKITALKIVASNFVQSSRMAQRVSRQFKLIRQDLDNQAR